MHLSPEPLRPVQDTSRASALFYFPCRDLTNTWHEMPRDKPIAQQVPPLTWHVRFELKVLLGCSTRSERGYRISASVVKSYNPKKCDHGNCEPPFSPPHFALSSTPPFPGSPTAASAQREDRRTSKRLPVHFVEACQVVERIETWCPIIDRRPPPGVWQCGIRLVQTLPSEQVAMCCRGRG